MRPCNQCRTPVENSVQLCEACEQYNLDHDIEPKPPVSLNTHDPSTQKPVPIDQSIDKMMLAFALSMITALSLTGWLLNGTAGLVAGALLGLALGAGLPAVLFR